MLKLTYFEKEALKEKLKERTAEPQILETRADALKVWNRFFPPNQHIAKYLQEHGTFRRTGKLHYCGPIKTPITRSNK
jgi:hypothetical protein